MCTVKQKYSNLVPRALHLQCLITCSMIDTASDQNCSIILQVIKNWRCTRPGNEARNAVQSTVKSHFMMWSSSKIWSRFLGPSRSCDYGVSAQPHSLSSYETSTCLSLHRLSDASQRRTWSPGTPPPPSQSPPSPSRDTPPPWDRGPPSSPRDTPSSPRVTPSPWDPPW